MISIMNRKTLMWNLSCKSPGVIW